MSPKPPLAPPKPDPEVARLDVAKAQFAAAVAKTKAVEGSVPPKATPPQIKAVVEAKLPPEKLVAETKPPTPKPAPAPEPKPKPTKLVVEKTEPSALEKQVAALSAKLEAALAPKQPEPEAEDDDPLEGVRAKLTERFGDDEAGALVEAMEARHAPLTKRIAQLESVLRQVTEAGRKNFSKTNQKRLAEIHPQLSRDEAWEVLHNHVVTAFEKNPKAYGSAEEAYDAISTALYGELEPAREEEASEETELAASRIAAAGMTAPAKSPRAAPRSRTEKAREVFNYLKKHPEDKAGAKRLARELGVD